MKTQYEEEMCVFAEELFPEPPLSAGPELHPEQWGAVSGKLPGPLWVCLGFQQAQA